MSAATPTKDIKSLTSRDKEVLQLLQAKFTEAEILPYVAASLVDWPSPRASYAPRVSALGERALRGE